MSEIKSDRLSPWWRHWVIMVMIAAFSVPVFVAVMSYRGAPPTLDWFPADNVEIAFGRSITFSRLPEAVRHFSPHGFASFRRK